ncbi:MAG TPA: DUF742 domain-containing protein [Actinomycetes bacterium]|jgi:hypothetical protein|nr:DUF742 domain-containing protein [Actinomycetes bacterium]
MNEEPDRHESLLVRPYTVTRGRTRSHRVELEIEALVSTAPGTHPNVTLNPEQRTIAALCLRRFQSIAEISALLRLPLGVVRVLVGDMADQGLVQVYQPTHTADERPDIALLERVLDGLRRL